MITEDNQADGLKVDTSQNEKLALPARPYVLLNDGECIINLVCDKKMYENFVQLLEYKGDVDIIFVARFLKEMKPLLSNLNVIRQ